MELGESFGVPGGFCGRVPKGPSADRVGRSYGLGEFSGSSRRGSRGLGRGLGPPPRSRPPSYLGAKARARGACSAGGGPGSCPRHGAAGGGSGAAVAPGSGRGARGRRGHRAGLRQGLDCAAPAAGVPPRPARGPPPPYSSEPRDTGFRPGPHPPPQLALRNPPSPTAPPWVPNPSLLSPPSPRTMNPRTAPSPQISTPNSFRNHARAHTPIAPLFPIGLPGPSKPSLPETSSAVPPPSNTHSGSRNSTSTPGVRSPSCLPASPSPGLHSILKTPSTASLRPLETSALSPNPIPLCHPPAHALTSCPSGL